MTPTWVCHLRSFWIQRPGILALSTYSSLSDPILMSARCGEALLNLTSRAWHFLALRLSPLFDAQSEKCWRSSCKLPWSSPPVFSANVRSLTYFQYWDWALAAASLMGTWKPIGPSLVPWGTPAVSWRSSESVLLNLTHCKRFWNEVPFDAVCEVNWMIIW